MFTIIRRDKFREKTTFTEFGEDQGRGYEYEIKTNKNKINVRFMLKGMIWT
jgi:hypothetical protein